MVTAQPEGKIILEKFQLDDEEMLVARKLVDKHAEKIRRVVNYQELKLEMRVHKKVKNNHFEIRGQVVYNGGKVESEKQDPNPFLAITEVLEKMQVELEHKIRK